jgi:polyphosphate kinase 2 (PPK2 family)
VPGYEDVLAARVRKAVDKRTWGRRYGVINRFEAELAEGGTRAHPGTAAAKSTI